MSYDSDLNFTFAHTPKLVFGAGVVSELGSTVGEMGFSRAVVVTDSFLAEKTDLLEQVKKSLGPRFAGAFTGVIPDPTHRISAWPPNVYDRMAATYFLLGFSTVSFPASRASLASSRRRNFWIFPDWVIGNSSTIST